jgi:hypothetical protein
MYVYWLTCPAVSMGTAVNMASRENSHNTTTNRQKTNQPSICELNWIYVRSVNPNTGWHHRIVYQTTWHHTQKYFSLHSHSIRDWLLSDLWRREWREPLMTTQYVDWSCKYFTQPVMKFLEDNDVESSLHYEREWRYLCHTNIWFCCSLC